jgi:hypothetical protein
MIGPPPSFFQGYILLDRDRMKQTLWSPLISQGFCFRDASCEFLERNKEEHHEGSPEETSEQKKRRLVAALQKNH